MRFSSVSPDGDLSENDGPGWPSACSAEEKLPPGKWGDEVLPCIPRADAI